MKSKKTLSNWLTNRYLLIIRNEENFAEKTTLTFNYGRVISLVVAVIIVLMLLSFYLVSTILAQWLDPRHAQLEADKKFLDLSMKVDSLELMVEQKDSFISNFTAIISGKDGQVQVPSADSNLQVTGDRKGSEEDYREVDSLFRKEFEQGGTPVAGASGSGVRELRESFFFSPLSGTITRRFDLREDHYGVDVVSRPDEPIKSVADGIVIFSDWTQEAGNVITIQHRNNLISVYKHNSALLKKVGSFVNAGDVIALIGNTGELTDGPHLHFEMWYNGNPVNPEEFISF